jgi:methionyl aminopeptidase
MSTSMSVEESLRIASDVHKHVRKRLRESHILNAGTRLIDIANFIETETKEHASNISYAINGIVPNSVSTINGGIGFPVGLSINNCAAHYHPHSLDTDRILSNSDILKVDFGTEVNGWIIDSAFTTRISSGSTSSTSSTNTNVNVEYSPHSFGVDDCESLISCMKGATELGFRTIGIDVRIAEWSESIEELIRSYDGIHPIYNLTGHDILHEIIHGNVRLPSVGKAVDNKNERFKAGVYAIETFGARLPPKAARTNGGEVEVEVEEVGEPTIFRLAPELSKYTARELQTNFRAPIFRIQSVQKVFSQIGKRFRTLPFCERYLQPSDRTPLSILVKNGAVMSYPPLCCTAGSITAQFEHTVLLKDAGTVTVFSKDDDY